MGYGLNGDINLDWLSGNTATTAQQPTNTFGLGDFNLNGLDLGSQVLDPAEKLADPSWNSWAGIFGDKNNTGWGTQALGAAGGIFDIYSGLQNYDLMKEGLDFQMDAWNKDYEAAKATTNADWNAQQERVASAKGEEYTPSNLV